MAYLDVSPMVAALRENPSHFEIRHGLVQHITSRHSCQFDARGKVSIDARCNCSFLSVRSEQERELLEAYRLWQTQYWQPLMINKEFASHFAPPPALITVLITFTEYL